MDELGMVNAALLERVMEVKMLREQMRALQAENAEQAQEIERLRDEIVNVRLWCKLDHSFLSTNQVSDGVIQMINEVLRSGDE